MGAARFGWSYRGCGSRVPCVCSFVRQQRRNEPPVTEAAEFAAFALTIPNTFAVSVPSPEGMAWISGGEFSLNAMDARHRSSCRGRH